MVPLPELIITVLIVISVLICTYYLHLTWHSQTLNHAQSVFVIHIVDALRKLCPVSHLTQWTLLTLNKGTPRCWSHTSPSVLCGWVPKIYGSSVVINDSPIAVLNMILDASNWGEWSPDLAMKGYKTEQFEDRDIKQDDYMYCKNVCSLGQHKLELYRFSCLDATNMGWVLFWNVNKHDWSFFLVQPFTKNEQQKCLLVSILPSDSHNSPEVPSKKLTFTLNCLKDAIEMQTAQCPVLRDTILECRENLVKKMHSENSSKLQSKYGARPRCPRNSKTGTKLLKLVPCYKLSKRRITGFQLIKDHLNEDCLKDLKTLDIQRRAFSKNNQPYHRKQTLQRERSEKVLSAPCKKLIYSKTEIVDNEDSALSKKDKVSSFRTFTVNEIDRKENGVKVPLRPRWYSESNLNNRLRSISKQSPDYSLEVEEKEKQKVENASDRDLSDFEDLLPLPQLSDHRIADMLTKGNYCASQLQAEILEASCITGQTTSEDQILTRDKWLFHSFYKDITVLSKVSYCGSLKIISFICKTDISISANEVWKSLRSPHLRFICDETVKKVTVLEEVSEDQKILHTYHEMNNLLKRETIDFCLLHSERLEHSKYYLALCSIEYINCPLMAQTIRGTLLPSGWMVEAENERTKVTYLYQIIANNPNSSFVNDLSSSLPMSVYNMKNYVLLKPTSSSS